METTVKSTLEGLLKSLKMSPYDLSKASGVQYTTIERILSGKTERPSKSTLAQLAKALNVEPEVFGVYIQQNEEGESMVSLLKKALEKLEQQIDRKDAMIEKLMNKLMGDPNFRPAPTNADSSQEEWYGANAA